MGNKISKIIFYKLKRKAEEIDIKEIQNEENKLNSALSEIINKDIKRLSRNLKSNIKEINDRLLKFNIYYEKELSTDIKDINNVVSEIKELKKIISNDKRKVKPNFFTFNKKRKKQEFINILDLESFIKIKEKSIVLLKDEYNKLNKKLEDTCDYLELEKEEDENDMLERTIKFYMNKND